MTTLTLMCFATLGALLIVTGEHWGWIVAGCAVTAVAAGLETLNRRL